LIFITGLTDNSPVCNGSVLLEFGSTNAVGLPVFINGSVVSVPDLLSPLKVSPALFATDSLSDLPMTSPFATLSPKNEISSANSSSFSLVLSSPFRLAILDSISDILEFFLFATSIIRSDFSLISFGLSCSLISRSAMLMVSNSSFSDSLNWLADD